MTSQNFCSIVLAAGNGSRTKSSFPKVFQSVAGLPILGHIILTLKRSLISQHILVLSENAPVEVLKDSLENVDTVTQIEKNGTGGAVGVALDSIRNDITHAVVLYGDTPLINSESINIALNKTKDSDIVVLAIETTEKNSLGTLEIDKHGFVKFIVEKCDVNRCECRTNLHNVGIIAKTDVLKQFLPQIKLNEEKREFFLTDIVHLAYNAGRKTSYTVLPTDEMQGVNTMSDLAAIERIYQQKRRQHFMNLGVKLIAPETVFFSYDTNIEPDVVIFPYVVFGQGVSVKRGATIESFTHISGAEIENASVGPFARLRAGTKLHNDVKIGNFVEVKNSEVAEKTKVNHLSYIGDTILGTRTNVGAGTITCNYDGYNKYKTVIGNEVFIGSNSTIIAPIKIGDKTVIAAGSTLTMDIPSESMAISRSKQENIPNAGKMYHIKRKK